MIQHRALACILCTSFAFVLCFLSSKTLKPILINVNAVQMMNIDLPGELVANTLQWIKSGNLAHENDEIDESGSVEFESEVKEMKSRVPILHRNGNDVDERDSLARSGLGNYESMGQCENGASFCKYKLWIQQRTYKAPPGCVIISTENLNYETLSFSTSGKASNIASVCVPAVIGTIKLDASYLRKMNMIDLNGESMVSFLAAGKGTTVAVFSGNDYQGDSYVLSGDLKKQQSFFHNWKSSSNDNVKSLIIHSTMSLVKPINRNTSSPKNCECVNEANYI